MDGKKVLEVISIYREYFEKQGFPKFEFPHDISLANYGDQAVRQALSHCHGMLDEMEEFVAQGRIEKAFRWLGFIQGVLWLSGCFVLEDLKTHNRPDAVS